MKLSEHINFILKVSLFLVIKAYFIGFLLRSTLLPFLLKYLFLVLISGSPVKPIRLMVGLLTLKQLENLSDESIVIQWKRNPYYQYFCGYNKMQLF